MLLIRALGVVCSQTSFDAAPEQPCPDAKPGSASSAIHARAASNLLPIAGYRVTGRLHLSNEIEAADSVDEIGGDPALDEAVVGQGPLHPQAGRHELPDVLWPERDEDHVHLNFAGVIDVDQLG